MASKRRMKKTLDLLPAEDLSIPEDMPPDTSSGQWVTVHTPYGPMQMTPERAARYEAEGEAAYAERQDVDALARAWDAAGMGSTPQTQEPQSMNGQGEFDPDTLALLQRYAQEGRLHELFQPFQQEQGVLDQEMALAQNFGQQRGPQRGSPMGALLGGLSNAIRGAGGAALQKKNLGAQTALGKKQQATATALVQALTEMMKQKQGGAAANTPSFEAPVMMDEMGGGL